MRHLPGVIALLSVLVAARAWAQAEVITDVQVRGAVRTEEQAVRSIAGIKIGDSMHPDTLDSARERLHTSGMFAEVNVYWEPHSVGVRVVIVVKEKFPWAPLPMFSFSLSEIAGGAIIVHGNLFGRGKRGVIGGRLSTVNSGALAAYEDPAVFGSWAFFTIKAKYQWQSLPEYGNNLGDYGEELLQKPMRITNLRTYGFDINVGVAWFRRVKTSVAWFLDQNDVRPAPTASGLYNTDLGLTLPPAAASKRRGSVAANLTFDFRARERAVMYGNSLGFTAEWGARRWGNQSDLSYWRASAGYEHGIRLFRWHNLVVRVSGIAGENLPLWSENSAGGNNLRGYAYRQFQGDTHLASQLEYHFPLFSLWSLDVRGLIFGDGAAIWWRKLPADRYQERSDGRLFLPPEYLQPGFRSNRDIHASAGAGVRFYLRTVAIPLLGVDVGHGLNGVGLKAFNVILLLGV